MKSCSYVCHVVVSRACAVRSLGGEQARTATWMETAHSKTVAIVLFACRSALATLPTYGRDAAPNTHPCPPRKSLNRQRHFALAGDSLNQVRGAMRAWAGAAALAVALAGCALPGWSDHGRTCGNQRGQDLSSRTVDGYTLSQHRLICANLEHSTLSGQEVDDANLHRADLHRTNLSQSTLSHVDLTGADLSNANLHEASLTYVDLGGATLVSADLSGVDARFGNLRRSDLTGADVHSGIVAESDLSNANLRAADLTGAAFLNSNLRGASLDGAHLDRVSWQNVVCPDGHKSSGDPEACSGHLHPAGR